MMIIFDFHLQRPTSMMIILICFLVLIVKAQADDDAQCKADKLVYYDDAQRIQHHQIASLSENLHNITS
jgi:hypothetical protein